MKSFFVVYLLDISLVGYQFPHWMITSHRVDTHTSHIRDKIGFVSVFGARPHEHIKYNLMNFIKIALL